MVLGATGIVGGSITQRFVQRGEKPFALSRRPQAGSEGISCLMGDLSDPTDLVIAAVDVIFSTVHPRLLAPSCLDVLVRGIEDSGRPPGQKISWAEGVLR